MKEHAVPQPESGPLPILRLRPDRGRHDSFSEQRRRRRIAARARSLARLRAPLAAPALATVSDLDVAAGTRSRSAAWSGRFVAVVASLLVHGGVGAVGHFSPPAAAPAPSERLEVEVRSPPPPAPTVRAPPPKVAAPEPRVPRQKLPPPKARPRMQVAFATAPPRPEPTAPSAPTRIVGLSLESALEGGSGPAFAVGNTRLGQSDGRAVAPKDVPRAPGGSTAASGESSNRVSSGVHSLGSGYSPPRCKFLPGEYPAQLKAQAIESQVTVIASIDASGVVRDVKIHTPSPYPEFNVSVRAAPRPRCEPATQNGVPFAQSITFTYRFRIADGP